MKIYIIAGEPSGDLLAAAAMRALRRTGRDVQFKGVGGAEMLAAGLPASLFDISEISVMGFFEVLPRLPLILKRIRLTVKDIEAWQPDVVVTVDSWGFVSAVLKKLRRRRRKNGSPGSPPPVVHYVAPQVWAWKKGRARSVARLVDRLMTLLPNEGRWFEKYGLQCDFVGHPVVERVAETHLDPSRFRAELGIPEGARVVCVLPGSRRSETRRLKPIFDRALRLLRKKFPDIFVVSPTSSDTLQTRLNSFAISEIAIAKSGTVSLELAAVGTPHSIAYTFNRFTNFLVKRVVSVRFANLINLLADREIVPEFVLSNCRPELIAACSERLLSDPIFAKNQVAEAQEILKLLHPNGTMPSDAAAKVILEVATLN